MNNTTQGSGNPPVNFDDESAVIAATTRKFGLTYVVNGKTYSWDEDRNRYMLTKRALIDDDGNVVVLKRAKVKAAKPELTKSQRKAMKAARRIAKAQKREARELMLKAALAGDPRFQPMMREAVLRKAPESLSRGDQQEIAKGAYADSLAKAAYDNIGLGNKPAAGVMPGDWTTAPGTARLNRMDIGGPVLGPVGIPPMPAGSVRNANIYGDGVAKDVPREQLDAIVAFQRQKFIGSGLQGADLADALASFLRTLRLNPVVQQQFAQIQMDATGSLTPTGRGVIRSEDVGGDLGSRSGSGKKKTPTAAVTSLTDRGAGAVTRATSKAAKLDKKQRRIAKRVRANAKKIAAAR